MYMPLENAVYLVDKKNPKPKRALWDKKIFF
jgi:hypothetical protein